MVESRQSFADMIRNQHALVDFVRELASSVTQMLDSAHICDRLHADGLQIREVEYRAVDTATGRSYEVDEEDALGYLRDNDSWDSSYRPEARQLYAGPWQPFVGSPTASETAPASSVPARIESVSEDTAEPVVPLDVRTVEMSVMNLEPGDMIVLRTAGELDKKDVAAIRRNLTDLLPPGHPVLIFQGILEMSLLRPGKKPKAKCDRCRHSMGVHYPTTGCIRCVCQTGRKRDLSR